MFHLTLFNLEFQQTWKTDIVGVRGQSQSMNVHLLIWQREGQRKGERDRESMCVCVRERECEFVCAWESEREKESVCVCVWERESLRWE